MSHATPEGDELVVTARDRALNKLIVSHDVGVARDYYDDKFVLTTSSGSMKTKDRILAEIAAPGLVLEVNETTDVVVRIQGGTAVLTGILHQRGAMNSQSFDVKLRVTDTWCLVNGEWRILAGHATSLPEPRSTSSN